MPGRIASEANARLLVIETVLSDGRLWRERIEARKHDPRFLAGGHYVTDWAVFNAPSPCLWRPEHPSYPMTVPCPSGRYRAAFARCAGHNHFLAGGARCHCWLQVRSHNDRAIFKLPALARMGVYLPWPRVGIGIGAVARWSRPLLVGAGLVALAVAAVLGRSIRGMVVGVVAAATLLPFGTLPFKIGITPTFP
jgi:hypothetical protein